MKKNTKKSKASGDLVMTKYSMNVDKIKTMEDVRAAFRLMDITVHGWPIRKDCRYLFDIPENKGEELLTQKALDAKALQKTKDLLQKKFERS